MSSKAFKEGDQVRVVENGFRWGLAGLGGTLGIVRSVDQGKRCTETLLHLLCRTARRGDIDRF